MTERLYGMIEEFLEDHRDGDRDSFAPVKNRDMHQLDDIIYQLITEKFDKDGDGDLPVQYHVVNRHKRTLLPTPSIPRGTPVNELRVLSSISAWVSNRTRNIVEEMDDDYP